MIDFSSVFEIYFNGSWTPIVEGSFKKVNCGSLDMFQCKVVEKRLLPKEVMYDYYLSGPLSLILVKTTREAPPVKYPDNFS